MIEFKKTLERIFYFAHQYGISRFSKGSLTVEAPNKDTYPEFQKLCYEGFYKAQDIIIDELKNNELLQKDLKKELKSAKKEKNRTKANQLEIKRKENNYKEILLRNASDSIAWILIGGQHYIARRLYAEEQMPSLIHNNLKSIFQFIEYYKQENPSGFCLVSDTTSFVQTGDFICRDNKGLYFMELKSGKVNVKIMDILTSDFSNGRDLLLNEIIVKGSKFIKQFDRVLNQGKTFNDISKILKNDEGFDPHFKNEIKIFDPEIKQVHFHDNLITLLNKINKTDKLYAIDIVENCVFIGVYKKSARLLGKLLIEMWMNDEAGTNYPAINYVPSMLYNPVKEPIIMKPFGKNTIFDLLFDRIRIYLGLNYDNLFELAEQYGLKMQWLSEKESGKLRQQGHDFYRINKKGISLTYGKQSIILGDSFFNQIIHDFILPSNVLSIYKALLCNQSK